MTAYIVSVCKVTNPHDNFKKYLKLSEDLLKAHGGTYVVRGKAETVYEGDQLKDRVVIISSFPSMEALKGFVESDAYKKDIAPLRADSGIYDIGAFNAAGE